MRPVAALCVHRKTAYRAIEGVTCYDGFDLDAWGYTGPHPIVAHPPCRSWSRLCKHQAKPEPGEKVLAIHCVDMLIRWGGVLEHPVYSDIFGEILPAAGESRDDLVSINVQQSWFGYGMRKPTTLTFSKCKPLEIPYRLHDPDADREWFRTHSRRARSMTVPALAEWLVAAARSVLKTGLETDEDWEPKDD